MPTPNTYLRSNSVTKRTTKRAISRSTFSSSKATTSFSCGCPRSGHISLTGCWTRGTDPTALRLPWRLLDFPPGYTLWVHLTGDKSDPANPRTDAYLHGSAHKIFRSPMEFVEHAIWLMKSGSVGDQCLCKYCTPGQNQRAINRRLDRRDGDSESDDEDGGSSGDDGAPVATAADIRASRHKLFRNRPGAGAIAAAAARQARRQGKRRERPSMQIKAKDYRVGNVGGSSGGGGSGAP
ncbi:hypothetical protein EDB89DRAFT_548024 [Lactarius sanguifluus]|nr:hypothetical protein EDB89DRAFT_548024 [Lactarius sanguifluus]